VTTRKQLAAAKRNIKKATRAAAKENDFAFAQENAHSSRQTRSKGCTKETGKVEIDFLTVSKT